MSATLRPPLCGGYAEDAIHDDDVVASAIATPMLDTAAPISEPDAKRTGIVPVLGADAALV